MVRVGPSLTLSNFDVVKKIPYYYYYYYYYY
jgi:hypothetical protein